MSPQYPLLLVFLIGCDGASSASAPDGGHRPDALLEVGDASADAAPIADAAIPVNPRCTAEADFRATHGPVIVPVCRACHGAGGLAESTRLLLPASVDAAFEPFRRAHAVLERNAEGRSYLLLKPSARVAHGGGEVAAIGGATYAALEAFVTALEDPAALEGCAEMQADPGEIDLMDARATLRKAALQLAGRPPTAAEVSEIEADFGALDGILRDMMSEPAFERRLHELFNDVLLTDAYRLEQSEGGLSGSSVPRELRALPICDSVNWESYDERAGDEDAYRCIQANEALAMEPLHLITHVVRENRSFGEILTAQYRYLNVFAARLFGIDTAPFAGHEDDPTYFAEVRIPAMHGPEGLPEEYAGLLTTNAFLYRYQSSSTNRNRSRSHYFYKYFRGIDVMKSSLRIDLSQVDLQGSPWRHDPQCIGCHTTIDPVAGAFQHWTNCYGVADVKYYAERYCGGPWFPAEDMFPPGTGPLPEDTLPPEQVDQALRHLAEATVQGPDFPRAIAGHVFSSLTGQPLLKPAADGPERAAFEAQRQVLDGLGRSFAASGLDFKHLVVEVVKTEAFRALAAEGDPSALEGLGGGALVPPELIHRKVEALFGVPWTTENGLEPRRRLSLRDPPYPLLSLHKMRILAGGIDSRGLRVRPRVPGALPLAVLERMALEMSCRYTAWDFAYPANTRHLFPHVEPDTAWDDPAINTQIRSLHDRFLGELLSEAELTESRNLLISLADSARATGDDLGDCAARRHFATGQELETPLEQDPTGSIRAWQGLLVYLMTDHRFLFEN